MVKKGNYKIPFDGKGNLLNYVSTDTYYDYDLGQHVSVDWKDNYVFNDELEYESYSHGRSSVQIYFISKLSKRKFNMSLNDFDLILKAKAFIDNTVKGTFTFAKRGANYMLTPVLPDNS